MEQDNACELVRGQTHRSLALGNEFLNVGIFVCLCWAVERILEFHIFWIKKKKRNSFSFLSCAAN